MPDQQQTPVGRRARPSASSACGGVEAARRAARGPRAARAAPRSTPPPPARRSGARARLGLNRTASKRRCQPRERDAGSARLLLARARSSGARSPRACRAAQPPRDEVARAGEPFASQLALRGVAMPGLASARRRVSVGCRRVSDVAWSAWSTIASTAGGATRCDHGCAPSASGEHGASRPGRQRPLPVHQPRALVARLQRPRAAARRGRARAAARAGQVLRDLHDQPRRVLHGARRRACATRSTRAWRTRPRTG